MKLQSTFEFDGRRYRIEATDDYVHVWHLPDGPYAIPLRIGSLTREAATVLVVAARSDQSAIQQLNEGDQP